MEKEIHAQIICTVKVTIAENSDDGTDENLLFLHVNDERDESTCLQAKCYLTDARYPTCNAFIECHIDLDV